MTPALAVHADPTYVALQSPFAQPFHYFGLELVVLACVALTLRHAIACYRAGDRWHLFRWLAILAYGVAMELIAFNFIRNYVHAQFSVELYHRELPLYVTCIYVVLHYTGIESVERLGLGFVAEAIVTGFAICLLDVPFDIVGADAGWWVWSSTDPNILARFLGVPVTSFYWYMLFGAIFTALCRALRGGYERRSLVAYVALAPVIGITTIVLGVLAFLPFHALEAIGVGASTIVLVHTSGCCAVIAFARREKTTPSPRAIRVIAVALVAWHVAVLVYLWSRGGVADGPAKLASIALAAFGSTSLAGVLGNLPWSSSRRSITSPSPFTTSTKPPPSTEQSSGSSRANARS